MAYDPSNEAEEASNLLALARQTHEAHVAAAKKKADEIVSRAELEAATMLNNAREEFTFLQGQITKHREFELRYRDALKNYLSDLLEEINVEDEFILAAPEASGEISAFSEIDEDEAIEAAAAADYAASVASVSSDFVAEPEPYRAPAEVVPEPYVESYNEPVAYEANDFVNEDYKEAPAPAYPSPAIDSLEEVVTDVAPIYYPVSEPTPAYSEPVAYDDPYDDLPAVPETLDSFATDSNEILVFDAEVQDNETFDATVFDVAPGQTPAQFDSFVSGEPYPAPHNDLSDSVADIVAAEDEAIAEEDAYFRRQAQQETESDEVDKKLKGFFGFKR